MYDFIDKFFKPIKIKCSLLKGQMKIFCGIVLLLFFSAGVGDASLKPEMVRVALLKSAEIISLDGDDLTLTDGRGESLRFATLPLQVKRVKNSLVVNGVPVSSLVATAPSTLRVNGKGYRGQIEIVPGDKGLLVINELPLEEYLIGLINCEISSQWPIEVVKAQAVIARSYALYQKTARKDAPYQLESSVMDQVYNGCDIEDSRAARGVRETAGEVLTYAGRIIQAFYHSNCGGHTEASENVWGMALPYLTGVDCKYCLEVPSLQWEQSIPLHKLEASLKNGGYSVAGLKDIVAGARNRSGRLQEVMLVAAKGRTVISAVNFRKAVGFSIIKSTNFTVKTAGSEAVFAGVGYGHGVGLCQWGAKQRAESGFDYHEILTYYYPGVKIEKVVGDQ